MLMANSKASVCYGTRAHGALRNGIALPPFGKNYKSFSYVASLLGRTYVHSKVHQSIVETYQNLAIQHPEKIFMYAETGFKDGGKFYPHKTHQNGLSVDFMVTTLDKNKKAEYLPTHAINKYGYALEFNDQGILGNKKIDFTAMALHLYSLYQSSKKNGISIYQVILDPPLQKQLFKEQLGAYLKKNIRFSKHRTWVRHDEHYHVDFHIPCKPLTEY